MFFLIADQSRVMRISSSNSASAISEKGTSDNSVSVLDWPVLARISQMLENTEFSRRPCRSLTYFAALGPNNFLICRYSMAKMWISYTLMCDSISPSCVAQPHGATYENR